MVPKILLIIIRFYRFIARTLGMCSPCRFYPSCSVYAEQAIQKFGAYRGFWMTAGRLLRCNPWHPGGMDFV